MIRLTQPHDVRRRRLQLVGILKDHEAILRRQLCDRTEERVAQRRFPRARPADEDGTLPLGGDLPEHVVVIAREDAASDILLERDDAAGLLADHKGGCGDDRWKESLHATAVDRELADQARALGVDRPAKLRGNRNAKILGLVRQEAQATVEHAVDERIHPDPAVRIDHYLDDIGLREGTRNRPAENALEFLTAPLAALFFRPDQFLREHGHRATPPPARRAPAS